MRITEDTLTAVLAGHQVPAGLAGDEELRAIARSMARLAAPAPGPEARFYAAFSEMPADSPGEEGYLMSNVELLDEIYEDQLTDRLNQLPCPDSHQEEG